MPLGQHRADTITHLVRPRVMDANHPPQPAVLLEAGQEALARGAWEEARSAFEHVLRWDDPAAETVSSYSVHQPVEAAEVLFGLGGALWWLGEIRESVRCWEQAYAAFRRLPDPIQATNVALQLGFVYQANLGNDAAGAGWAAQAERLVDQFDLEPMRGWVSLIRASSCLDLDQSEVWAREARRLAIEFGDRDLELCALGQLGATLIDQGRIGEGVPLIDEAMAGALAGEGQFDTVVFTSCLMIDSCNRCADFLRVVQWVRAADRFIEQYGCPFLNATGRANYGSVLFATGDWTNAEVELRAALELSGAALPPVRAEAAARLAGLRLPRVASTRPSGSWRASRTTRRSYPCARESTCSEASSPLPQRRSNAGLARSGKTGWRAPCCWSCSGRPRSDRESSRWQQREGASSPAWVACTIAASWSRTASSYTATRLQPPRTRLRSNTSTW